MAASRASTGMAAFGALFLVVGLADAVLLGQVWLLLLAVLGVVVLTGLFSVPLAWLSLRRLPDHGAAEWETEISSAGISEHSEGVAFEAAWTFVREVRETRPAFLVATTSSGAFFLPRRAFTTADETAFRGLLDQTGIPLVRGNTARRVILAITVLLLIVIGLAAVAGLSVSPPVAVLR